MSHLFRPTLSRWRVAIAAALPLILASTLQAGDDIPTPGRERVRIDDGWRFYKYPSASQADALIYDVRPQVTDNQDARPADARPTEGVAVEAHQQVLKPWILPSGNDFISDPARHHVRPAGDPGSDFPFVQPGFDDSAWEEVTLPHDWAIAGPFMAGPDAEVGGGMGRLPVNGVAWYRRALDIPEADAGKRIFLDVDGAMSYAEVWLNGHLVGGWPYGYNSFELDLTPYVAPGGTNELAIRLDNPNASARWYPGGGIYRDVRLVKTQPLHVAHWGTTVTTSEVSKASANVTLEVHLLNDSPRTAEAEVTTQVFALDEWGRRTGGVVATFRPQKTHVGPGGRATVSGGIKLENPRLWGPPPTQQPNRYVAVTTVYSGGKVVDTYRTPFGIRTITLDPDKGLFVNGEHIFIKGVNQHADLGPLGMAFNARAAGRQLEILRDMGCNAVRLAHNPPDPALLELTDRMGFLVIDEVFDCWYLKKTPLDFHLIFPDWHEQDLRAMIRRDHNHPSIFMWSVGNEVGEQYTGEDGAKVGRELTAIAHSEDPTRPTMTAMNYAKPDMPLPATVDTIALNYQGEGIRDVPAYAGLKGIHTPPMFPKFHSAFPAKTILSSENASALSSRGVFLFPVFDGISAPARDGSGGDPQTAQVSAYELYTSPFGASADKVFASEDAHPFVAGGFVWSGWDYLGEPTPYYSARSSYSGIIDLAGFPKERFWLYQARWRPDLPMAHILPHWNWPGRAGKVTPVHVFTSGDEAELFLNGKSLGRKRKPTGEYRLRWSDVKYEPGTLKVVAYKGGREWATDEVSTTGAPSGLRLHADRNQIAADGRDVSFVTVRVVDGKGRTVPTANGDLRFNLEGPGEIVATANGDPTCMVAFPSHERPAFNGLCLVIVRGKPGHPGKLKLTATGDGIRGAMTIRTAPEK